jgi:arabinofuranosyltransferase
MASSPSRGSRLVLTTLAALVALLIVRAAWLCDDSYITMRTVDNFVHGFGLRWNTAERVQTFTHPLWFWCLVPLYLATGSARLTLLFTSLVAAFAALAIYVRLGWRTPAMAVAVLLALGGSKSFIEYSTSGLEEPLLFGLVAAIVALAFRSGVALLALVLLCAFVFLTRMDAVLLVAPLLARVAWSQRRHIRWGALLTAALPAVSWLAFATFYYGVPFPNTAYAKLGHRIPRVELVQQGARYLVDFATMDPAGTVLTGGAIAWMIARRRLAVPAGIALWTTYVVWIGGDFMSGRLMAPAVWMAAVALVAISASAPVGRFAPAGPSGRMAAALAGGVGAALLAVLSASPAIWGAPTRTGDGRTGWRVTDERQFYYPTTGVLAHGLRDASHEHPWALRVLAARDQGQLVQTFKWVGFSGYFAGPRVHLIDEYGLADPLLARLPAQPDWAPGHFLRPVPEGYAETLIAGENRLRDPQISRYYERLVRVTRGPLLASGRFEDILWLNLREPRVLRPAP